MKRIHTLILLCLVAVLAGCKTGRRHTEADFYYGDAAIEAPVRHEYRRQLELLGLPGDVADTFTFEGIRLEPTGRNRDGYYGNLVRRAGTVAVHGAYSGAKGQRWVKFWFAYPADGRPDADTVAHETGHLVIRQTIDVGGHPMNVAINGRTWKIDRLIGTGVKWPMLATLWNAVRHPIAVWKNSGYLCIEDGDWNNDKE